MGGWLAGDAGTTLTHECSVFLGAALERRRDRGVVAASLASDNRGDDTGSDRRWAVPARSRRAQYGVRMRAVQLAFAVGWAAFWLYWLTAAFSVKRGRVPWSRHLGIRAVMVVAAIILVRTGAFHGGGRNTDPWRAGLGLVLFGAGLAFAIWARVHIGRNWGIPMTQKEEPELVTSGPYRLVRHPIYSGILLAGVGTAVALNWLWLIAVVLAAIYFVYSATEEERYLTERCPETYPAYKRSTKMLVPFIF
jgi:protein-S-isoprenylcysteine O-methyltransferase Ste14